MRTAADIMTREVRVLDRLDPLTEVDLNMELFGLRHLPVVEHGRLIGLVSHRDLLRWSASKLEPGSDHRDDEIKSSHSVSSVMTRDVETCAPGDPIADVARRLLAAKFGCLPVVEDGRLVGIITEYDLLKELVGLLDLDEQRCVRAIRSFHPGLDGSHTIEP